MECVVDANDADSRLDRYVRRQLGHMGQAGLEKALRSGKIRINGNKQKASYRLVAGDKITIHPFIVQQFDNQADQPRDSQNSKSAEEAEKFLASIELQRSDDWIAFNKPSGLAVQGGSKTQRHLDGYLQHCTGIRPKLVHRIDKDTSGLLLVARHDGAARMLTQHFKAQEIAKSYLAVVKGDPGAAGIINAPLLKKGVQDKQKMVVDKNGQDSQTAFIRLDKTSNDICLVALKPITGRTHQLRAHLDYIGCPILGDGKYGGGNAHFANKRLRLHLHAQFLRLVSGQILTAPLPDHINNTVDELGFDRHVPHIMPEFNRG